MPTLPFLILDVFTDRPLAGNQLAVFPDGPAVPPDLLQPLALEMGFSETTFLFPPDGDGDARVRIFTPRHELPFAGHPILGTAVALAMAAGGERVVLETGAGPVAVAMERTGARSAYGRMEQPVPSVAPYPEPAALLAALGLTRSELPIDVYDNGVPHVYVTLPNPDAVDAVAPDLTALTGLAVDGPVPLVGVNTIGGDAELWTTRMFAPAEGIAEDAATGSAAGPLAVHLARHGRVAFGRRITIRQGVRIGRPSTLHAVAHGSPGTVTAVEVGGGAVLVAEGQITA